MVRDVRFITLNSTYRDLQEMLLTSHLKTLALVESRGMYRPRPVTMDERNELIVATRSFLAAGLFLTNADIVGVRLYCI